MAATGTTPSPHHGKTGCGTKPMMDTSDLMPCRIAVACKRNSSKTPFCQQPANSPERIPFLSQFNVRLNLAIIAGPTICFAVGLNVVAASLARIIHERFCCNRGFAAAQASRQAGSPLGRSTSCSRMAPFLTAPRARHGRLTGSAASASVTLIMLRVATPQFRDEPS